MGHVGTMPAEYLELVQRLDAGQVGLPEPEDSRAREARREILEMLFTPEEAALASRMPNLPARLGAIAERVGMSPEDLEPRLNAMADKGVVMDLVHPDGGETLYMLAPPVVGFFEATMFRASDSIPKKRMAEALDAYMHHDPAFAREVFEHETVIGRSLAHETALERSELPEVLDWERASAVVDGARSISVTLCYCRHKNQWLEKRCDVPMENCMQFNGAADWMIRREFGRSIDKAEATDILTASRENSLVQIADNIRDDPTYICNCCPCCCGQLSAINDFDLPAVNPSGFQPTSNLDKCKGCGRCSRACPVGSITMIPRRSPGRRKAKLQPQIDLDRCIGCGVCVDACLTHAMGMERRPKQPRVPVNTLERVVRMSLERGRLPDLLFDAGASRGSKVLNGLVRALCALPPVEKAAASEQVRSRFVQFALKNVKVPV